jgi:hypothetical protein
MGPISIVLLRSWIWQLNFVNIEIGFFSCGTGTVLKQVLVH